MRYLIQFGEGPHCWGYVSLSALYAWHAVFEHPHLHSIYKTVASFSKASFPGIRIWKLKDMDKILTWSPHHTALLGDACHPVPPFGFSGASMAIEDAVTRGKLFPSVDTTTNGDDGDDRVMKGGDGIEER